MLERGKKWWDECREFKLDSRCGEEERRRKKRKATHMIRTTQRAAFSARPLVVHASLRYPREDVGPLTVHERGKGSGNEGARFGEEGAAPVHRSAGRGERICCRSDSGDGRPRRRAERLPPGRRGMETKDIRKKRSGRRTFDRSAPSSPTPSLVCSMLPQPALLPPLPLS